MTNKKWIQGALKYHKKGALSKQLGISQEKNIPNNLLVKIKNAKIGDKVSYKKKHFKVTQLLKRRVNFALNLKNIRK